MCEGGWWWLSQVCRKWSRNSVSWVGKRCRLFPPHHQNMLMLNFCGPRALWHHPVPTLTRAWASRRPQRRQAKQWPHTHLLCQLVTVKPTTSHSHFYKAACMWHVPSARPSEVGVNPRPRQTRSTSRSGTFNSLFWLLLLNKQCRQTEVTARQGSTWGIWALTHFWRGRTSAWPVLSMDLEATAWGLGGLTSSVFLLLMDPSPQGHAGLLFSLCQLFPP